MALIAVGVTPNLGLAQAAGLQTERGLIVNEFLQTSDPAIYSGGDMIQYPDPYLKTSRHVEHEEHARVSGRHIARNLLGDPQPYEYLAMVWSDVYDLSWEFWGEFRGAERVVYRGDLASANYCAFWLQGARMIGAMLTLSREDSERQWAQEAIKSGMAVDPAALSDETVALG